MATVQLGNTKQIGSLIDYCEKKAEIANGIDCSAQTAKQQMEVTRALYDKRGGVQAHHVIQSFKPNEIDAQNANMAGLELARKIAPNHEVMVYTHTDKEHIHNHLVINSVNYETGKKYQSSKKDLYKIRDQSDEICKSMDLSIVKEKSAEIRYTLAEKAILEKGLTSWKDELRQAIDLEKENSSSYFEFKNNLEEKYNIVVNDQRKHITYKHPDAQKVVRGNKLGLNYEKETIEHGFRRQIERTKENTLDIDISEGRNRTTGRTEQDRTREHSSPASIDGIQSTIRDIERKIDSIGGKGRGNSTRDKTNSNRDKTIDRSFDLGK